MFDNYTMKVFERVNYSQLTEMIWLGIAKGVSISEISLNGKNFTYLENGKKQVGRMGKVLRRVLSEIDPDFLPLEEDLQYLINQFKANAVKGEFKVVEGEDIRYWYHYKNSKENQGVLNSSCMNKDECQSYFNIYIDNGVKMVILLQDGLLIGRALLWKDKYMDRIYGNDITIELFKNYAKDQGYFHKTHQSYDTKTKFTTPTGENVELKLTIELDKSKYLRYPYLDTFTYLKGNTLSNTYQFTEYELNSPEGERKIRPEPVKDFLSNEMIDGMDAVYPLGVSKYTHKDNCYLLASGDYALKEHSVEVYKTGWMYYKSRDIVWVDEIQQHASKEQIFKCNLDGKIYLKDNNTYTLYKGKVVNAKNIPIEKLDLKVELETIDYKKLRIRNEKYKFYE